MALRHQTRERSTITKNQSGVPKSASSCSYTSLCIWYSITLRFSNSGCLTGISLTEGAFLWIVTSLAHQDVSIHCQPCFFTLFTRRGERRLLWPVQKLEVSSTAGNTIRMYSQATVSHGNRSRVNHNGADFMLDAEPVIFMQGYLRAKGENKLQNSA